MASDFLTVPAPAPEPGGPAAGRPARDATSNATRLLCAGTYLDPVYRTTVIRELLTHRYRVVAPSYGYDAVPVLGHALAARRLHRIRLAALAAGFALTFVLMATGTLSGFTALLMVLWLLWATAFFRRVATLQLLTTRLGRRTASADGTGVFDGSYPGHPELTPELVRKIDREQSTDGTVIRYGGYKPFVGAGTQVRRWSYAQLLIGAPLTVFDDRLGRNVPAAPGVNGQEPKRKEVIPFTVEEMTAYVTDRMRAQLRDAAGPGQRIEGLAVERSTFTTAVTTLRGVPAEPTPEQLDGHGDDDPDAGRTYLCIRVGSWNQELVTTAFVGFDLKGNTLHTEFHSYVLAPIQKSFQLVDRLPGTLDGRLLLKVAWHTLGGSPRAALRSGASRAGLEPPWSRRRVRVPQPLDTSEFGLGRYADLVVNRGAVTSIRELATGSTFHVFFQETDTIKYTQIVERQLLHVIRDFLYEHNVDLAEYEARQTNILNQDFGSNNSFGSHSNFGPGSQDNRNSGTQTFQQGA
jgi:hypothetical protein